jgi:hypothetical protein
MASHVRILSGYMVAAVCAGAIGAACGESTEPTVASGSATSSGGTANAATQPAGGTGNPAAVGTAEGTPGATTAATPPPAQPPAPTPPPAVARLRVIHASPDPAAATAAIYLDGATTPAIASLAYKAVQSYSDLPAAAHTIAIRPASAAATTPAVLEGHTEALTANHNYTAIAHGLSTGEPRLALATVEDNGEQPEAGHAHLRFFHALAGVAAVDVCMPGSNARAPATPVFPNVAYGAWGQPEGGHNAYANVPTGHDVKLQVRLHNDRVCSGAVQGVVTLDATKLPDRSVQTAIAVGQPTARPAIAKELLVCTDAPVAGTSTPSTCNTAAFAAR